jgi:hypothetical protein
MLSPLHFDVEHSQARLDIRPNYNNQNAFLNFLNFIMHYNPAVILFNSVVSMTQFMLPTCSLTAFLT